MILGNRPLLGSDARRSTANRRNKKMEYKNFLDARKIESES